MSRALLIPYTFTALNWAVVVGLYHFMRKTAPSKIWMERSTQRQEG